MGMCGVLMHSFIAGSVVSVIGSFNAEKKEMDQKRQSLSKFMKDHNLLPELKKKLTDHLEFSFVKHKVGETMSYELDKLLDDLAPALRTEVLLYLHRDLVAKMNFFKDKSDEFIVMVVTDLRPRIAYPNDVIIKVGEKATAMYFINTGKVFVLNSRENGMALKASLSVGEYFGETGCLLNRARQNTVIAAELTELYSLSAGKVLEIMEAFPEWQDEVRKEAIERVLGKQVVAKTSSFKQQKVLDPIGPNPTDQQAAMAVDDLHSQMDTAIASGSGSFRSRRASIGGVVVGEDDLMSQIGRIRRNQQETSSQVAEIMRLLQVQHGQIAPTFYAQVSTSAEQ